MSAEAIASREILLASQIRNAEQVIDAARATISLLDQNGLDTSGLPGLLVARCASLSARVEKLRSALLEIYDLGMDCGASSKAHRLGQVARDALHREGFPI